MLKELCGQLEGTYPESGNFPFQRSNHESTPLLPSCCFQDSPFSHIHGKKGCSVTEKRSQELSGLSLASNPIGL